MTALQTALRQLTTLAAVALAACGAATTTPTPSGSTKLAGSVRGPVGSQVTLQANGASLSVTVVRGAGNTDAYDVTPFSFDTALADGTAYTLSIQTPPPNQVCSVYKGASGTLPVVQANVLVGCEYTFDLVSRSSTDAVRGTYFESQSPSVGGSNEAIGSVTQGYGEGRFVAFVSYAKGLAAGSTDAHRQIFWRDTLTGTTTLVSAVAGVEGNGDSWAPAISASGLVVVFESYATNLVASDTNGVRDVFIWSALDNTVQRVSVGAGGAEANAASYEPTVSGDGRIVAFTSAATNLVSTSLGLSTLNVYRRDLVAGTTTMVSTTVAGAGAGGSSPALSEDGQRIAFWSFASNIVAVDPNGLWDIFVYDHANGSRTRVSLTSTGGERNQGTDSASRVVAPSISGNGRYVAYSTTSTNVVPGDTNDVQDVFVVDTQTSTVTRASVSTSGAQGNADSPLSQGERPSLSYTGDWVAFSTAANTFGAGAGTSGISNVVMHHRVTGETRAITNQTVGSVGPVSLSRNAAYVTFGAATPLDGRFTNSGLFSGFTNLAPAWFWVP